MTTASLLGLLLWAVPVQLTGTCLRCWPDAAVYFTYDTTLLLGQDSAASDQLGKLFLGDVKKLAPYGFLEREHMEREAGNLFHHLEQIIQKSKNPEELMKEAKMEKEDFIKRLGEASASFVKEICSFSCGESRFRPYEVVQCRTCQILKASCYDLRVCAGPNVAAAVSITLLILLGAIGAAVWYYRRNNKEETESQGDEEDNDGDKDSSETSESSESSEKSEKSEEDYATTPAANDASAPETNISSPPEFNTPNPPDFNIPSPPTF